MTDKLITKACAYLCLQLQSQRATSHPRSEREWVRCRRARSPRRHFRPHHHHHPRLAAAPNSGAANVAIAAKPNWSWYSKSWVPVAVVRQYTSTHT